MQYTIYINQQKCIERWLSFNEWAVIDVMSKVALWAKSEMFDWEAYYYISSWKLSKECPMVSNKKNTLLVIVKRLIDQELLERKSRNNRSYYRLTEKTKSWYRGVDGNQGRCWSWSIESVDGDQYDNITINHNTNIIDKPVQKKKTKKQFIPPTKKEVIDYFEQKWYITTQAKTARDYYDAWDWKDSRWNAVKSWKQKMISVWMKPEFKVKKTKNRWLTAEQIEERLE